MTRILRAGSGAVCLALGIATSGCATIVNGSCQDLVVNSNPSGAHVEVNGQNFTTPTRVPLKRRETFHRVTIAKPGYETNEVGVGRKISPWLVGNLWFAYPFGIGTLAGGLIDFSTGGAYKLDRDKIDVQLRPLTTADADSATNP